MQLGARIQTADWKKEKHAPVIECPAVAPAGELFEVKVGLGKEIAHPNTVAHHIRWIELYFHPEGEKFTYDLGRFEFNAHGEGPAVTHYAVAVSLKIDKPGTIHALALCNLHGLWESSQEIGIE
ncbi:MAG: class II SORL domain-containing protein [Chloroflexota bacterium]|nr:class II SORL domain-containing protein [Chloroflexota bacterium]